MEELESKAREFEVLQNLNLPKVLNLLESKEEKIAELRSKDKVQEAFMLQVNKAKSMEMQQLKRKFD